MPNDLSRVAPPALPQAPERYSFTFLDQYSRVLRLFFSRLSAVLDALTDRSGGAAALYYPFLIGYHGTLQTAAAINTAYPIPVGTVSGSSEISVENSDEITFAKSGFFSVCGTLQVGTIGSTSDSVTVWLRKNGTTDVAGMSLKVVVDRELTLPFCWGLSVSAGDYIQIQWAVTSTDIQLPATAASSPYPAVDPLTLSVAFMSNG